MSRRLVIFDIGKTLVTGPELGPARRIAARLGLGEDARLRLHRALMTTGFAGPEEVARFTRDELGVDGAAAIAAVWRAQEDEAVPVAGAADLLRSLHAAGFTLALLSNIWPPYLTSVRRHFGALFDELIAPELQVFSFAAGEAKPSAALLQRILVAAGVPAARAVMVGDSLEADIEPARALGLHAIWIGGDVPSVTALDVAAVSAIIEADADRP